MPEYLGMEDDVYNMPGFLRAFQLWDVVFFYRDNTLYHYAGHIGGWHLHKTHAAASKQEAEALVEEWANSY